MQNTNSKTEAPLPVPPLQDPPQVPLQEAPLQAPPQVPLQEAPLQAPPQVPLQEAPPQAPLQEAPPQAPPQAPLGNARPNIGGDLAKPDPKPTILVMHASVGSGHKAAADAIAQALRIELQSSNKIVPELPDDVYVEVLDSLRFARVYIDGDKTASGFVGPTRPIYDVSWRYFFTGRLLWNGGSAWLHVMFPKFAKWVEINKPAAIVCTHITAANIAVGARMVTKQHFPIICVPTDYEVEGQWPHLYTDLFCAASEYMAETLRARRVPENRIQITGIPVSPKFSLEYDREVARDKWNLPKDKKVALVLAGARLPRPYLRFRETLFQLLSMLHGLEKMEFVIVAGSDADYASKLIEAVELEGLKNVRVLNYVTDMAELMSACDMAICKAGGLIVTECLCARIPMILVGKAYGQEKINVRMLTSLGAAMHVQTARELYETLNYASRSNNGLRSLVFAGDMIRKPNAAKDIAQSTLRLAFTPLDEKALADRLKYHFIWYIGKKPAHTR